MNSKIREIQPSRHFKVPGIDSNKRLTRIFRNSLKTSWVHPYIRVRGFLKNYNLPVIVTVALVIVVGAVILVRTSERASLAGLLTGASSDGQDYATLLSKDKNEDYKKNESNDDAPTQSTSHSGSTSSGFAVSTNTTNTGSSTGNGGGSGGVNQPPPNEPPPDEPFSAELAAFGQTGVTLVCSSQKPNKGSCSKRYDFSASIRTFNGPGTVDYSWQSNASGANENSNFSAGSGTVLTTVQKSITLACNSSANYNLRLVVSSPTQLQSNNATISHNCNDI